jgi:hypothetical protein
MIMTTVAKAVHRGADGSVHYLMSTEDSSLLVITDPVLGVDKIRFDGPVRKKPPRQLNRDPHPGEVTDGVEYESISATGTTMVSIAPGRGPLITQYGFCVSCAFPPAGQLSRGHDYSLWPVCPGGEGSRRPPTVVQAPEGMVIHHIGIDHQKAFPVPGPGAQPAPEPAQSSSNGTGGEPTGSSRGKPRMRVLDAEPAPEPAREPVRGMQPVPVATEPDWTDLSQVDGPSWGP